MGSSSLDAMVLKMLLLKMLYVVWAIRLKGRVRGCACDILILPFLRPWERMGILVAQ